MSELFVNISDRHYKLISGCVISCNTVYLLVAAAHPVFGFFGFLNGF